MNPLLRLVPALALACFALPGHALYKVVGPDGTVTYTDRPPPAATGRPAPVGARTEAPAGDAPLANLPLELRQVSTRYPVTLYTGADCAPCETGRRLLAARGVPFAERRVSSEEDAEALNRLTGGRSIPTLMIGTQALRGFADSDWHSYLDAAGYPRESRLPRGYQQPAATPLVQRQAEAAAQQERPAAPAPAAEPAPPPPAPPAPAGIRF
ncbi:MAG TPA: glutaredoxin family protein [Burkholderiaceae bacterium]|nr:glutaredoxin family protein [Burkholderiaceae bacterium]